MPLLQWILSWWSSQEKSLVLAADASTLSERFTVLPISVVYRGCGIPVAWKIVGAKEKGSWKPHWKELFEQLQAGIPSNWKVIFTTDRGLYAKWLYEAIIECQWHPFMRINSLGLYQPLPVTADSQWMRLSELICEVGQEKVAVVNCFKSDSLSCTLLARWEHGYRDPWLIVTDLPPLDANICWYGMRSWIECLFKDIKRGGFGWHHTKMTDPQRAERLWLAIAVATLWLVSIGGKADERIPASSLSNMEPNGSFAQKQTKSDSGLSSDSVLHNCYHLKSSDNASVPELHKDSFQINDDTEEPNVELQAQRIREQPRWLSCLRRGLLRLLAALTSGETLPTGGFIPDYSLETG